MKNKMKRLMVVLMLSVMMLNVASVYGDDGIMPCVEMSVGDKIMD